MVPAPRFLGINSPVSSEREQKGPGVLTLQERKLDIAGI